MLRRMSLRLGRPLDFRMGEKGIFQPEKMSPREWERLKMKGGAKKKKKDDPWSKNLEEQEELRNGHGWKIGLKQKKNASSCKFRAREVRIDDEVFGFVIMEW